VRREELIIKPLVIIGAGGFGREVAWLVSDINNALSKPQWDILGFVDDSVVETAEGYSVLGGIDWLNKHAASFFVVCAIGNPSTRKTVIDSISSSSISFGTLIHPSVKMSKYVTVLEGSIICSDTIITTNVKIGRHCILNLGTRIGHDSVLDDYSSLMPGVNIAGDVVLGKGSYLGLNASVINKVRVGDWTTVGAGATVVSDLPEKCVAVGIPAKPIKFVS
jgi:sugar O-acyltransferase (sialic acid O-acetyltransferase NeuD family)